MDEFNQWLYQFITSRGRGTYKPKGTSQNNAVPGKPFIGIKGMDHPLFLDSPEFDEWLEEKREAFAGLKYLETQMPYLKNKTQKHGNRIKRPRDRKKVQNKIS